jgi:hypothetical protein
MNPTADPYDELAAMFLTSEQSASGSGTMARDVVELLAVGHLPVRASLWLSPYADAVARRCGPSALVRLDGDETSVQVYRGEEDFPPASISRDARSTINQLGGRIATWIVMTSVRTPISDLLAEEPDRITILSSADQAAIVNAYRLVKDLAESAEHDGRRLPPISLAVIGAESEAAEGVARRIDRTTREHLGVPVELGLCLPRMDAGIRTSSTRTFDAERPAVPELLRWIREARRSDGEAATAPTAAASLPAEGAAHEPTIEIDHDAVRRFERESASAAEWAADPAEHPARTAPLPESLPGVGSARTIKFAPKAAGSFESKQPARSREPQKEGRPVPLADYVPGLRPIRPRCPGHERIELAVDDRGRIHLLGRDDALREMTIVETWAITHRELLAMACPDESLDPRGETVRHLFTDDAVRVSDLHGANLRLHLLAPVLVEGREGWFAAPLNSVG